MPAFSPQHDFRSSLWYLVPLGLVLALCLVGVLTVALISGSGGPAATAHASEDASARLPSYWTVKAGQTYGQIAQRSGLTVDELETFNPYVDPTTIVPGMRLKLHLHVASPKPKPLGPRFWIVRTGQSFDSIATKTGRSVDTLRGLNRGLRATDLQPGDRVRLRR